VFDVDCVSVLVVPRLVSCVLLFVSDVLPPPPAVTEAVAETLAKIKSASAVADSVPDACQFDSFVFELVVDSDLVSDS